MDPSQRMSNLKASGWLIAAIVTLSALLSVVSALAADTIEGQVLGGGAPIAKSTVTLWSASADAPASWAKLKPLTTGGSP